MVFSLLAAAMNRESEIQKRFGASVKVTPLASSESQLFLILGPDRGRLAGLVSGYDGRLVLSGPGWGLAEMGFSRAMALRGHPEVRLAGGVSVDAERLKQFRSAFEAKEAPGQP